MAVVGSIETIEEQIYGFDAKSTKHGGFISLSQLKSPRKDVVTGLIKNKYSGTRGLKGCVLNGFAENHHFDDSGAERLLPNGDMLFEAYEVGSAQLVIKDPASTAMKEIANVVKTLVIAGRPEYDHSAMRALDETSFVEMVLWRTGKFWWLWTW